MSDAKNNPVLRLDNTEVTIEAGDTILAAARRAGLATTIPALCHRAGSAPDGGCGLCLVHVADANTAQTGGRLERACHTLARPGDEVTTRTTEIAEQRRRTLELMLAALPAGAREKRRGGGKQSEQFWQLLDEYAAEPSPHAASCKSPQIDESHPYLRFDPDICITCRRCLHTCEDLQGQFVFGIGNRGADVRLLIGAEDRFADSPCVACGACVDECPTGALFDRDRAPALRPEKLTTVRSTCGYCGVGCGIDVVTDGARVLRIDGAADSPVNQGHFCARGR